MTISHEVHIEYPPGTYAGNEERYELVCVTCDYIDSADTLEEAQCLARVHEQLVSVLIAKWEIPS